MFLLLPDLSSGCLCCLPACGRASIMPDTAFFAVFLQYPPYHRLPVYLLQLSLSRFDKTAQAASSEMLLILIYLSFSRSPEPEKTCSVFSRPCQPSEVLCISNCNMYILLLSSQRYMLRIPSCRLQSCRLSPCNSSSCPSSGSC